MKDKHEKVPVQKGPINPHEPTMKGTPRPVQDMEALRENSERARGQRLEYTEPRKK